MSTRLIFYIQKSLETQNMALFHLIMIADWRAIKNDDQGDT